MRALLLPIALTALAAGCGTASADPEQTASQPPARDLTLRQDGDSAAAVASPVELGRPVVQPRVTQVRQVRKVARAPRRAAPAVEAAALAPAVEPRVIAVASVSVASVPAETEAPDPHALAPGQTVTVLPASTTDSPSGGSGGDWTDALPAHGRGGTTIRGGGGGDCGGRGHGGRSGGGFRGLR